MVGNFVVSKILNCRIINKHCNCFLKKFLYLLAIACYQALEIEKHNVC